MTTTDSQGILYLEDTDIISPFHTLFNTAQSATSAAVGGRLTPVGFTPQFAEWNTPVPLVTAPGETGALVTVNFTLSKAMTVMVFAETHVEPGGNAAGELRIKDNGTTVITRQWHSRATSQQQWPSVVRWVEFAAGSHTVTMTGTLNIGSSGTSYDHSYISVGAR